MCVLFQTKFPCCFIVPKGEILIKYINNIIYIGKHHKTSGFYQSYKGLYGFLQVTGQALLVGGFQVDITGDNRNKVQNAQHKHQKLTIINICNRNYYNFCSFFTARCTEDSLAKKTNRNSIGFNGNYYDSGYWYVMDCIGGMLKPYWNNVQNILQREFCIEFNGKR